MLFCWLPEQTRERLSQFSIPLVLFLRDHCRATPASEALQGLTYPRFEMVSITNAIASPVCIPFCIHVGLLSRRPRGARYSPDSHLTLWLSLFLDMRDIQCFVVSSALIRDVVHISSNRFFSSVGVRGHGFASPRRPRE